MRHNYLKFLFILATALWFSLVAWNNSVDFHTNFEFVKEVVSMKAVISEKVSGRAITSLPTQQAIYLTLIFWEVLTALVCWIGVLLMLTSKIILARRVALLGITMGFSLFFIGFFIIANEWFYLWNSPLNGFNIKTLLLSIILGQFALVISQKESSPP